MEKSLEKIIEELKEILIKNDKDKSQIDVRSQIIVGDIQIIIEFHILPNFKSINLIHYCIDNNFLFYITSGLNNRGCFTIHQMDL